MRVAERREGVAHRDGWITLGLVVSATAAGVSSFSGLRLLALVTGWPVMLAPLLPACIDSYAATSVRVWLAASTRSQRARRFAHWNAEVAILLSLAGNAVSHLITAHVLAVSWFVVLAVGAVPPVVLGLVVELAVLRGQADPIPSVQAPGTESGLGTQALGPGQPAVRPEDGPRYATEEELVVAAREADQAHRARNGGKPLTRDALRRELRISGARATAVARRLRQERTAAASNGKAST